jgi:hypothetical protein
MQRLPSDPTQVNPSFRVSLDGTDYTLTYLYNFLTFAWYVDLQTLDGEYVFAGARLSPGGNLMEGIVPGAFSDLTGAAPPGAFICTGPDPYDRYDLSVTLALYYATAAEVEAAADAIRAADLVWKEL